jgi:integrase
MHIRLKHVKPVKKRLASGETVTYYYHRVTGRRIHGQPGTGEFLANYEAAGAVEPKVAPDSVAAMLLAFRSSGVFVALRERTKADYEKILDGIGERFGTCELEAFNDPRIRRDIMEWREGIAKRSRKQADYAFAVLRRTLQWAYDQGMLAVNHAMRGGKLYTPDRSDKIWEQDKINAFMRVAHETLKQAFRLALDTGQRQGDLLALTWTAYDGDAITLRQSKRKRKVYVPLTTELRMMLDRMPRRAATILTNQGGLPWTEDGFRTMFDRAKRKAAIEDRTFHDLRGTFVTRASLRGLTPQEIATITGQSTKDVERILDTYLARTPELARQAMRKYEKGTKNGNRRQPKWKPSLARTR